MLSRKKNINLKFVLFMLFFVPVFLFGQDNNPAGKTRKIKHLLSLGPVISFYKNHPKHTANTKLKPGFNVAYRLDIPIKKRMSFVTGAEYYSQGFTFKGYYFAPGHSYLYDETFAYTHDVRFNEVLLPLGIKFAANREKDHNYTAYIIPGIDVRYIYNSYFVIISDSTGITPYDGKGDLSFTNYIFTKNMNTSVKLTFGVQRNFRKTGKGMFLEFTYRYGISRLHYEGNKQSNDLNISNSSLGITFGLRL